MNRFVRPLAAAVAALVVAAPAAAGVSVTSVNTGGFPTVHATVVSSAGAAAAPRVTENGRPVAGLIAQNLGHAKAVVLAIDDSRSMIGAPLRAAVAAAASFIASKPRADAVAVLAFGPHPVSLSSLSTATIDTDAALRNVTVAGRQGTALYDAIVAGTEQLRASPLVGRVLIVLTDGRDVSSKATLADAIAGAREAGVSIYPIGIESKGFDPGPLQQLAGQTGGHYYGAASTAALAGVYSSIAKRLGHTWTRGPATISTSRPPFPERGRPHSRLWSRPSRATSAPLPHLRASCRNSSTGRRAGSSSGSLQGSSCSPRSSCSSALAAATGCACGSRHTRAARAIRGVSPASSGSPR